MLSGLESPGGLALDASGDLYFVDTAAKHVQRLDPSGNLASFAEGTWITPRAIALGNAGDFFVADAGLNAIVHVDSAGNAAIIAGPKPRISGDAGPALEAQLNSPWDLCADAGGALDIADLANNRIRQLVPQPATIVVPAITVVNAASLQPGPVAPGMLIILWAPAWMLGRAIAGALRIGGRSGSHARQFAAPGRNAAADRQLAIDRDSGFQQRQCGQVSATVAPSAPALFANPSGQATAVNQDGTLNSASNPAAFGSIMVLYGTGEGVAGLPVTVAIGGYPAQVLYSGPVAGYAGLWQINVVLPSGYIPPGNMSVLASVGGSSTQAGVTIAAH